MTSKSLSRLAALPLLALVLTGAKKEAVPAAVPAGCAVPAAGKLAAAKPVSKKERGKFSIESAPWISKLNAGEICTNNAKMRAGGGVAAGASALGLSSQVLNTQAGRMDLVALPAVEKQLQALLVRYAQAWPYQQLPATPRILFRASDLYDAYALPDNTIVMSLGTLQQAESDSEIMFVLAHEYAHLLMGHHLKSEQLGGTKQLFKAAAGVYTAGVAMSQLRAGSSGLSVADRGKVDRAAKRASVISAGLQFALDDIFEPAWNRDQENEADALAMDLLVGSNMTIDNYENVFNRLQKAFEAQKASKERGKQFAQGMQKGLEAALKDISSDGTMSKIAAGNGGGLMKSIGGSLATNLGGAALGGIGSLVGGDSHLPPEDRRKGLSAYFQAGYPTAEPPIDNGVMIKSIKALPEFTRAIGVKDSYLKARTAYFGQDFTGAAATLKGLGAGSKTAPTFVNYLAGLVARDSGNRAQAKTFFDAGRTGTGVPNVQLYETFAEMRIDDRDFATTNLVLSDASQRFRDPDHFKSIEIRRDLAEGDSTGAQSIYSACLQVQGRDYIPERCKAAMPSAAGTEKKKGMFGLPIPNPIGL
jgi:Zn-dependent protease with chaperone function